MTVRIMKAQEYESNYVWIECQQTSGDFNMY